MEWDYVDRKIARIFPSVKFVSAEKVLAKKKIKDKLTIMDVRLPSECSVSHIPEVRNLHRTSPIAAASLDYAESIFLHYSMGFRSASVAKRLDAVGCKKVGNLRHWISEWSGLGLAI